MPVESIQWVQDNLRFIDQIRLPQEVVYAECSNLEEVWEAIRDLRIRGAPLIGVAAAFGVVLGTRDSRAKIFSDFKKDLTNTIDRLASARPTAVNLFWALKRMEGIAREKREKPIDEIKDALLNEARRIMEEDRTINRKIGHLGSHLLKDGDIVLTYCNAGALATVDYGTALGVIYAAKEEGKSIEVYSCETRPLLQGARLTVWELLREGIDTTLICDNAAADIMKKKKVNKIIVGADRIARNGDTANKIGTYNLAVLARAHKIDFLVVAPRSTFDLSLKTGEEIPIEERAPEEVKNIGGKLKIAADEVKVYNPAFDVTPHHLITAIITELGVIRVPYEEAIGRILKF